MQELTLIRPDDFHVHLRDRDDLLHTVRQTASVFGRALIMPNLRRPVLTASDAERYRQDIEREAGEAGHGGFRPLMTIQLLDATTPAIARQAREAGVTAAKLYPAGVTTNSHNGVTDIRKLYPVFAEMEACGLVLCLHGEAPGIHCLDREVIFLDTLRELARAFPKLRIVLEHLSTAEAVHVVEELPDTVAATITAHHLILTLDDVVGDLLRPHHFCKPIPKRYADRDALRIAATQASPKFFFGSDSAPHPVGKKHCASGCAGVFSAPVALPLLAEIFERHGALGRLEAFVSLNGAAFYGLPANEGSVRLVKREWRVPESFPSDLVPFKAGETLAWRVVG